MKMHEHEVDIDVELVRGLVASQFPGLAALPVSTVQSTGTVNAIYRLGAHLCARLPRVRDGAKDLDREWRWLPELAAQLPLRIPEPVAKGHPTSSYPFPWGIYTWIDGRPYSDELVDDEGQAAQDLARFVLELRRSKPVDGAPHAGRRPLREHDVVTRAAIESAREAINNAAAVAVWERSLEAPVWTGAPVWIHADLLRPNVLVRDRRICAVIDFGGVGIGDPAADVIAAWSIFGRAGRAVFRSALEVDDGTWNRARGFALLQAAMIIPYYRETNPEFVALARRTIEEVLADGGG